jgi:hypothetical protein
VNPKGGFNFFLDNKYYFIYIGYELMDHTKNIFDAVEKGPFTTAQLAKILNRPVRFCVDWTERGLFVADVQEATGPGSRRQFSYRAVFNAGLALLLQDQFGFNRSKLKKILNPLSKYVFFETRETAIKNRLFFIDEGIMSPPHPPESDNELTLIIINTSKNIRAFSFPLSLKYTLKHCITWILEDKTIKRFNDIIGIDLKPLKENIDSEIAKL